MGVFNAWDGFAFSDEGRLIVLRLRLPRAIVGFAVGGILATSGLVCQSFIRTPLATPTTLGVSGGAALGASIAILLGGSFLGFLGTFFGAVLGAGLTTLLIFSFFRFIPSNHSSQIVLIGILVNYLLASVILLIQCVVEPSTLSRLVMWLIGAIPSLSWKYTSGVFGVALWYMGMIVLRAPQLQVLALGEDAAESRGISVRSLERSLLLSTSVGVGSAIAACGGIGFVGILEPQICRLLVGSDLRVLTPAVFLLGGSVVLCADMMGRVLFAPFEIPAGVLTALVEIPIGLILLLKRR